MKTQTTEFLVSPIKIGHAPYHAACSLVVRGGILAVIDVAVVELGQAPHERASLLWVTCVLSFFVFVGIPRSDLIVDTEKARSISVWYM